MRGLDLNPNFGRTEMNKVLRQYGRYIKPVESRAKLVQECSKEATKENSELEK